MRPSLLSQKRLLRHAPIPSGYQRGISLIELLVGIAIGLLTIAVGLGALIASRSLSGTVSDATNLQQQASYAFRIIGSQIRQAGSLELNLNPDISGTAAGQSQEFVPVAFDAPDPAGVKPSFDRNASTVSGFDNPSASQYAFIVGHQNYSETLYDPTSGGTIVASQFRDCLRQNPSVVTQPVLSSRFRYRAGATPASGEIVCLGVGGTPQAIIQNVAGFVIRYGVQTMASTGLPRMEFVNAATAALTTPPRRGWADVYAVEVCIEMVGAERIDTAGTTYTRCDNTVASRSNRLRSVYRQIFQIRSQGQPPI